MRSPDHSRLSLLETERFTTSSKPLSFLYVHTMYILPDNKTKEIIGNNPYICSKNCSQKNMIESVIRNIQNMANKCISRDLKAMNESLSLKLHYFDNEQRKSLLAASTKPAYLPKLYRLKS